ncbi:hypothetical protein AB0P17_37735 [Streptomyces sp. NPDC088124]|uniref:hypothetical protein n=1 Tax=Streptomyces sp. NPDC088124 TaxID=3154654 RepID=UPI003435824A
MPARTHSRSHSPLPSGGVETRLPWWSVALPSIAFVVLFLLVADPAQAHAVPADPTVGRILEQLHLTLAR